MIFHDIYSITIGQFELMATTKDVNRVKKLPIWIPKKIVQKAHNKLLIQHNENSSANKIKELVSKDFDILGVNLDVMQYDILKVMISIYYKTWGEQKKKALDFIKVMYKGRYGKEPTEEDFLRVAKDQALLIEKAQQVFGDNKDENKEEYSISRDIMFISEYYPTIRSEKLYLLPMFIEETSKKINNKNG